MFGFGFRLAQPSRRGPAAPPPPPPPLAYLPTLSTAGATYHGVWSPERLIAGYAGPLIAAEGDVFGDGATGVSPSAIATKRGTSEAVRLTGLFDQTGHGRHMVSLADAERAALREDVLIGGRIAMAFDGTRQGDSRGTQARRAQVSVSVPATDCTFVYVLDPNASVQEHYYHQLSAGAAAVMGHLQYPKSDFGGALADHHGNITVHNGAGFLNAGRKIATVPQVIVMRSRAAGVDMFVDGAPIGTVAATASGTADTCCIGFASATAGVSDRYIGNARWGAALLIDKAVGDADVAAITSALMSRFGIPSSYDAIVIQIGTSRVIGDAMASFTRNKAWFERPLYGSKRVKTYNLGQDGRPLTWFGGAAASNWQHEVYEAGKPCVLVIDDAINDLRGYGASAVPADIYATMTGLSDGFKALGSNARSVVATTLPQSANFGDHGISDADVNAARVTLNGLIAANGGGATAVADPASSLTMGAYPTSSNDPARYPDKLHPSSLGYFELRTYNPAAVLTAIA